MEQWHWWVLALIFVCCIAVFEHTIHIWLTLSTTVVGVLVWLDPQTPNKFQFLLFGFITLTGMVISSFFSGNRKDSQETPIKGREFAEHQETDIIGRVFTLEEPIVNGKGKLHYNSQKWQLRGKDAETGSKIRVVSIDGIDQTLLQVTDVNSTTE